MRRILVVAVIAIIAGYVAFNRPGAFEVDGSLDAYNRVKALSGCWTFVAGRGTDRYLPQAILVRLDTIESRRHSDPPLRQLQVVDTAGLPALRIQWWARIRGSRDFVVFWGDGHTGLELRLDARGDTLVGRAYRTTDFDLYWPRSFGVRASRADCAGSPAGAAG